MGLGWETTSATGATRMYADLLVADFRCEISKLRALRLGCATYKYLTTSHPSSPVTKKQNTHSDPFLPQGCRDAVLRATTQGQRCSHRTSTSMDLPLLFRGHSLSISLQRSQK